MATVTLAPGPVTLTTSHPGTRTPHVDSALVGDPPQWSDGSDATYALVHNKFHATEPWGGADRAIADLDPFAPTGEVTAVAVTFRASSTSGTNVDLSLYGTSTGSSSEPFASIAVLDLPVASGGGIQDVTGEFVNDDSFQHLDQAVAALIAGASVQLYAANFGTDLTIYEVSLTVTTADVTQPATRMYPRDDNLGLGSPRLYPHPKSGRVVGGYL